MHGVELKELRDCLLAVLPTLSREEYSNLAHLLTPLRMGEPSVRHCLRCHCTYDASVEGEDVCVIPHTVVGGPVDKNGDGDVMMAACCGSEWFATGGDGNMCFRGSHTDDPEDMENHYGTDAELVKYAERLAAAAKNAADPYEWPDWRGPRLVIKSCSQAGCAM